jgi:hypothetical protein
MGEVKKPTENGLLPPRFTGFVLLAVRFGSSREASFLMPPFSPACILLATKLR